MYFAFSPRNCKVSCSNMFFPTLPPVRTPSPPSSSSASFSSYSHKLTSFGTARGPPFVVYKIRHHQAPHVHKALVEIIPDFDAECDSKHHITKATRHDTQVLFATQDCVNADLPQEAILLSLGRGGKMQIFHANKPVCEGFNWFKWTETTAETLSLQKIELPHTFFREDLAWMLRAHASREFLRPMQLEPQLMKQQVQEDCKNTWVTRT